MQTLIELQDRQATKGEIADEMFPDRSYDSALPQPWLNAVAADSTMLNYDTLLSTIVWRYSKETGCFGMPAPLCEETAFELRRQGIRYATV